MRKLTEAQTVLLTLLSSRRGIVYLNSEQAKTATTPEMSKYIALGCEGAHGSIAALITEEGRTAISREEEKTGRAALRADGLSQSEAPTGLQPPAFDPSRGGRS